MKSQTTPEKSYNLFRLLKTIGVPWSSFLVPSVFSLLSGLAEGLNLLLLLPLCRGLVGGNYGFLKSEPWFQKLSAFFHVSNLSNTVIFSALVFTVFILILDEATSSLDQGQVLESGALQELLAKKGKFYELWKMQRFG